MTIQASSTATAPVQCGDELPFDVDRGSVVGPVEQLRGWAAADPSAPFVKFGGEWITVGELDGKTDRVAAGLLKLGLVKGDRLAIMLPTAVEYVELIFACAKLGIVFVPINVFLKGEFLRHQLSTSGARAVVGDGAAMSLLGSQDFATTSVQFLVGVDGNAPDLDSPPMYVSYASLAEHGSELPEVSVRPDDLMSLMFTSGTTGLSKACKLSHAYYFQVARMYIAAEWVAAGDKIVTALPLYHAGGQIAVLMSALFSRSSVSFLAQFHASTFMRQVHEEGATTSWGVAAMAAAVLAQPESSDPPMRGQLRLAVWIPLDIPRQEEFERRFGTRVVSDGYGQTEATAICLNPVSEERLPGTVGRAASLIEVRIVDDLDNEVPDGETGEFAVRPLAPGAIFSGYWENDSATVSTITNLWYHTGDYGRKTPEGAFAFVDRKKDAMRRRGENVSSIELEVAIRQHPLVDEVAVHAVASPMTEDDIKACIVARGERPEPGELLKYFETHLPYFCIPRFIEFFDELPVNGVGRVLKHQLRERALGSGTIDLTGDRYSLSREKRR
ncbi:acyl-CoA synthetase [Rhodococcus sp. WS4]|nr:acyl-CoA synthetase [Rhodococcus sp. WS4]